MLPSRQTVLSSKRIYLHAARQAGHAVEHLNLADKNLYLFVPYPEWNQRSCWHAAASSGRQSWVLSIFLSRALDNPDRGM